MHIEDAYIDLRRLVDYHSSIPKDNKIRLGKRKGVCLNIADAWPPLKAIILQHANLRNQLLSIVGPDARLVQCEAIRHTTKQDQLPHTDHNLGFKMAANLFIDLENKPLRTLFYPEWPDHKALSTDGPLLVFDTFTMHGGAGLQRYPELKSNQYRIVCVFVDILNPRLGGLLLAFGAGKKSCYPPTLGDIDDDHENWMTLENVPRSRKFDVQKTEYLLRSKTQIK